MHYNIPTYLLTYFTYLLEAYVRDHARHADILIGSVWRYAAAVNNSFEGEPPVVSQTFCSHCATATESREICCYVDLAAVANAKLERPQLVVSWVSLPVAYVCSTTANFVFVASYTHTERERERERERPAECLVSWTSSIASLRQCRNISDAATAAVQQQYPTVSQTGQHRTLLNCSPAGMIGLGLKANFLVLALALALPPKARIGLAPCGLVAVQSLLILKISVKLKVISQSVSGCDSLSIPVVHLNFWQCSKWLYNHDSHCVDITDD